jgi:hypothetical protein
METLQTIKNLVEAMSVEADKVFEKGNRSAATRTRKYAQDIKNLLGQFRKEILEAAKK